MTIPRCHSLYEDLVSCSDRILAPMPLHKVLWCLREKGLIWTARIVLSRIRGLVGARGKSDLVGAIMASHEVLNLRPGDWVEVRSEQEIRERLDANGRTQGLL
jgi:hypothetical protein